MFWIEASHPEAGPPCPAGLTRLVKAGSPHGVKPGRALRRTGLFLKAWASSQLSLAPHCLEIRLPTRWVGKGGGIAGERN